MKYASTTTMTVVLLITIVLTGCSSPYTRGAIDKFEKPHKTAVTSEDYILQPPDEIEVQCSKVPEIHMQRQLVRPDGMISFEVLGEIPAAGKTLGEVSDVLKERVKEFYKLTDDKPIDVRVIAFRSSVYYVVGQVYIPGPKVYTGRDTVLTAIAAAGINPMAWEQKTRVIRPSHDKNVKPEIFKVNYKTMVTRGDLSKNVLLQEGDIIYVPPTLLARLAMVIEEFARPIGRAFSTITVVAGPPAYRSGGTGAGR